MKNNKRVLFTRPIYFLRVTLISIFVIELFLMQYIWLIEGWGYSHRIVGLIDAVVLTFLLVPVLYLFFFVPTQKYIREIEHMKAMMEERNSELDNRVQERTAELIKLNNLLEQEYVDALTISEERYRNLIDNLSIGVSVISLDLEVLSMNAKLAKSFPVADFSQKPKCFQVFHDPLQDKPCDNCSVQDVLQKGEIYETTITSCVNGINTLWRSVYSPLKNKNGQVISIINMMENVTEKKNTEEALRDSEEKFRAMSEAAKNAIIILDFYGKMQYCNPSAVALFGFKVSEVVGAEMHLLLSPKSVQQWDEIFVQFGQTGTTSVVGKTIELMAAQKNQEEFPVEVSVSAFKLRGQWHAMVSIQDITDRKRIEKEILESNETLREMVRERTKELEETNLHLDKKVTELEQAKRQAVESRDFYLTLFDEFPALIWQSGIDTHCNYFNKTWLDFTGRTSEQEIGDGWTEGIHPDDLESCMANYLAAFRARTAFSMEYRLKRYDGIYRWVVDRGSPYHDAEGNFAGYVGSCYDVTDKKLADEALTQSKDRYRSLIKQSSEGIFIFDLGTRKIQEVNNQLIELLRYNEADIIGKQLEDLVQAEIHSVEQNVQRLLETGEIKINWRKFRRQDGSWLDCEVSASVITYGAVKVALVSIRDITERIRGAENQRKGYARLRRTLNETVNAFMILAEKRDPYTAGHQHRVAQLAVALAREMGLEQSQVEGLEIAAKLHDIGKVYVPAEILNKPGLLTVPEMSLIKIHPIVGQEILGNIPFEAPVGEIIAQHHERLNGSGYPKGLIETEIRLEAKILAVADTVEAVASHRPYRPALGLPKAFEELERNKGILYDPKAVEACLRIFRGKDRFSFESGNPEIKSIEYDEICS